MDVMKCLLGVLIIPFGKLFIISISFCNSNQIHMYLEVIIEIVVSRFVITIQFLQQIIEITLLKVFMIIKPTHLTGSMVSGTLL